MVQLWTKTHIPSDSVAVRYKYEGMACLSTGGREDLPLGNETGSRQSKELLSCP